MKLYEKTLSQKYILKGKILNVRVDDIELPNGNNSIREVIEHHGGVCIAPIKSNGKLIFVRQFRYPFGQTLLELPAGKLEKDENPLEAAVRELSEECGATALTVFSLGREYPTVAYCTEVIYMYCAHDLTFAEQHLDDNEFLNLEEYTLDEAVNMVMNDEIRDSKTQIAILKLARLVESGKLSLPGLNDGQQ